MKLHYLAAAVITMGCLTAMPVLAQTTTVQKQRTQEGGPSEPLPCAVPFNADPAADPDCKQHTQNLSPSPAQANLEAAGRK